MDQAEDEEVLFRLGPIELELQVEIEKTGEAETDFKVWVVSVGASGKLSSTETHCVTLSLEPRTREGGDIDVGRRKRRERRSAMEE